MSFILLFVFVSWILMMPYPSGAEKWDRELYFPDYYFYAERRLVNHTIKTMSVKSLDDCEYLCYMEDACVSLNIKNKGPDGTHECELNNSTHMEDDGDLVENPIYYYRGAKNNCGKSGRSCQNNATCLSGFTDKKYRCLCTSGFTGEHCEKDINECVKSSHKCHVNATCINTKGSYNCSCKKGYSGNGHNCTDIDECAAPVDPCSAVANAACKNTNGSYVCECKDGFVKNGGNCEVDVCQNYQSLSDAERKHDYVGTGTPQCDDNLNGWYRFEGDAGTKMVTSCPPANRCDAHFPGWLDGAHPTVAEGAVEKIVCFRQAQKCCADNNWVKIRVKNCGSYYIYKFSPFRVCPRRYCGSD